jgi:hypothetical protein
MVQDFQLSAITTTFRTILKESRDGRRGRMESGEWRMMKRLQRILIAEFLTFHSQFPIIHYFAFFASTAALCHHFYVSLSSALLLLLFSRHPIGSCLN